jgi:hypothetical protein
VQLLHAHDHAIDRVDFQGKESLAELFKIAGRELVEDISDILLQFVISIGDNGGYPPILSVRVLFPRLLFLLFRRLSRLDLLSCK